MARRAPARPDPRVVGGVYLSGYWHETYTVLARRDSGAFSVYQPLLSVRWSDGHQTVHQTAWDWSRDKIISEPEQTLA